MESHLLINILEPLVLWLYVQCWTILMESYLIQIQLDNATAVAYISHQRGIKSITLARQVFGSYPV